MTMTWSWKRSNTIQVFSEPWRAYKHWYYSFMSVSVACFWSQTRYCFVYMHHVIMTGVRRLRPRGPDRRFGWDAFKPTDNTWKLPTFLINIDSNKPGKQMGSKCARRACLYTISQRNPHTEVSVYRCEIPIQHKNTGKVPVRNFVPVCSPSY